MNALDVELHDTDLIDEIALLADLMVVACESPGPLPTTTIDATLGVRPALTLVHSQRLAS